MAFRVSRRKVNPNEVEINEAENQKICQQIWREWNGQVPWSISGTVYNLR